MNEDKNKSYVYTVWDSAAKQYGPLFEAVNDAVALRMFRNLIRSTDPTSQADYSLKCLGEFNRYEEEGQIKMLATPRVVEVKLDDIPANAISDAMKSVQQRIVQTTKRGI